MIYSGDASEQRQSVRNNKHSTIFPCNSTNTGSHIQSTIKTRSNAVVVPVSSTQEGDRASVDNNSQIYILTIDGQHWDISNLGTSSSIASSRNGNIRNGKLREVKRLYPQITDDEEDIISKNIDNKTQRDPLAVGCTLRRKSPLSLTLQSYANGPSESPAASDVAATEREETGLSSLFQSTEEPEAVLSMVEATSTANAPLHQPATVPAVVESTTRKNSMRTSQSTNPFYFPDEDEEELTLEVAPGVDVLLRGSAETRAAIYNCDILRAHCLECTVLLHCIDDAEYLLCPLCRCVSPLALCVGPGKILPSRAYGVGLGFQSCPKSGRRRRQESEATP